ncbi:Pol polyprotein, partial [Mucuna pruriens]
MDILEPFPKTKGQVKFLLVNIDYFTKWIEAESLARITTQKVQKFIWQNIICRYKVPNSVVTDNGTQFISKTLHDSYKHLKITHKVTLIEHPQANKVGEPSSRGDYFNPSQNSSSLQIDLNLVEEAREQACIRQAACKQRASRCYNSKVQPRGLDENDLAWRRTKDARKNKEEGKLAPNWDGLFHIRDALSYDTYRLE